MQTYRVRAKYIDPEIQAKVVKKENTDISFVHADYSLTVNADDMKKAYDIAVQYLPINSEIEVIELDYNPRYGKATPF